jgi:hypothetical protein
MALTASFSPVEIRVNKFMPTKGAILKLSPYRIVLTRPRGRKPAPWDLEERHHG